VSSEARSTGRNTLKRELQLNGANNNAQIRLVGFLHGFGQSCQDFFRAMAFLRRMHDSPNWRKYGWDHGIRGWAKSMKRRKHVLCDFSLGAVSLR